MVTTVADTLFHRLIDAFPAEQAYSPSDFSQDPMPEPLREYLEQRLALRLDDAVRPVEDWIDADHPEVRKAAGIYRNELARHLRIPASAWRSELERACRTVASYLIRPAPTLTDLVFADGRDSATLEDIAVQFRLLPAYSYFEDVIDAYFEQKNLDQISRERFAGLARRIDHQMVRDFETDEWMNLLEPLLDVARQIPEFSRGLPLDVMKTFLEEKGSDQLIARLEARFKSQDIRFIRSSELRNFFERPLEETPIDTEPDTGKTEERAAPQRGSHVPLWKQFETGLRPSSEEETATKSSGTGAAAPTGSAEGQPLWKQFHGSERLSPRRESASREERSTAEPKARDGSGQRNESTRSREEGQSRESTRPHESGLHVGDPHDAGRAAESTQQQEGPDGPSNGTRPTTRTPAGDSSDGLSELERAVLGQRGLRNRDLFLKHLFSGSSEAYEDTLRKLNVADNWSEASQIIAREVFLKHQVNIYSDPAVAFTDAAEARFRS